MAGVSRTKRKDGTYYPRWRFWFIDYEGKRRWATGTTNKKETQNAARALEQEHREMRLGLRPIPRRSEGLDAYDDRVQEYLDWGRMQGGRRGGAWGATHAESRIRHLSFWGRELSLQSLRDLKGSLAKVERVLRELKKKGRTGKTQSNYAESLSAFCAWCVDRDYLDENPLLKLKSLDTTPETIRRALTASELQRLLNHAPPERALLYAVACVTGLRAGELASLTKRNLDIPGCGLNLNSAHTKNRKSGFQPLPVGLMATLEQMARFKGIDESLLEVPSHTAREMDKDLKASGIPKETDEGKVDFHALRTAFCTLVFEEGANVKEGQSLMRHADPKLTMNTYARSRNARLAEITESVADSIGFGQKCAIDVQSDAVGFDGGSVTNYQSNGCNDLELVVLKHATN